MAHNMIERSMDWFNRVGMVTRLACARFVTQDREEANPLSNIILTGILGMRLEREPSIAIDSTGKLITLPAGQTVGEVLDFLTGRGLPSKLVPQCGAELALQLAKPGYSDSFPPRGMAVPDIQFLSGINRAPLPEHCMAPVAQVPLWEMGLFYVAAVVGGPLIVVAGLKLLIEGVNSVNGFRSWLDQPPGLGSNFEATWQAERAQKAARAAAPIPPRDGPAQGPGYQWGRHPDVDEFGVATWLTVKSPGRDGQLAREGEADRVLRREADIAGLNASIPESRVREAVAKYDLGDRSPSVVRVATDYVDRKRMLASAGATRVTNNNTSVSVDQLDARQQTAFVVRPK